MSLRDGRNVVVLIVCVLTGGVLQPPSREPCLWSLWNRTNASQLAKKTGERGWLDEHHSCHRQSLHDHEVEEELLAHPLLSVQGHPDPRYSRRLRDDHKKCNAFTTNTTIFTLKWAAL